MGESNNPIVRFFQNFWDWLNERVPERSPDALVREQEKSYEKVNTEVYQDVKDSGGKLNVLRGKIEAREGQLRSTKLELNRITQSMANLSGQELEDAKLVQYSQVKKVAMQEQALAQLKQLYEQGMEVQRNSEIGWTQLDTQRDVANAEAELYADQIGLNKLQEEIFTTQMAALGKIKGAKVKDNRGRLKNQADYTGGRVASAARMAQASGQNLAKPTFELSEAEQAILDASIKEAEKNTENKSEKHSAS
jgi:hypothetical protein